MLSDSYSRRVADALHLIAEAVRDKGLEAPESLCAELPYWEGGVELGLVRVCAKVELQEHEDVLQRRVQNDLDKPDLNKRYVQAMEEQIKREVHALTTGDLDD